VLCILHKIKKKSSPFFVPEEIYGFLSLISAKRLNFFAFLEVCKRLSLSTGLNAAEISRIQTYFYGKQ